MPTNTSSCSRRRLRATTTTKSIYLSRERRHRARQDVTHFAAKRPCAPAGQDLGVERGWRNLRSVWRVAVRPSDTKHLATYPAQLIEKLVPGSCPPGGIVLDVFNGSGTTGEVALRHGRRYVGVDLSARYLAATAKRLGLWLTACSRAQALASAERVCRREVDGNSPGYAACRPSRGAMDTSHKNWRIVQGDALRALRNIEDKTVDAVVTDPPYEIGYGGNAWDGTGIAFSVELWEENIQGPQARRPVARLRRGSDLPPAGVCHRGTLASSCVTSSFGSTARARSVARAPARRWTAQARTAPRGRATARTSRLVSSPSFSPVDHLSGRSLSTSHAGAPGPSTSRAADCRTRPKTRTAVSWARSSRAASRRMS